MDRLRVAVKRMLNDVPNSKRNGKAIETRLLPNGLKVKNLGLLLLKQHNSSCIRHDWGRARLLNPTSFDSKDPMSNDHILAYSSFRFKDVFKKRYFES